MASVIYLMLSAAFSVSLMADPDMNEADPPHPKVFPAHWGRKPDS